ncbi:MAG: prephenate dehydratase domain-containing protein [Pyrinomonadaceae bacterium]
MNSVAIQGAIGSYSEEAATRLFGTTADIHGYSSFFETFQAVLTRAAEFAVIPVRNTIIGDIKSAINILSQTDLRVHDELSIDICHVLVGTADSRLEDIVSVRSHVEALKQCRNFFANNPNIEQVVGADTASSIKRIISESNAQRGAIGSRRAAELYGGKLLLENVANETQNQTTFYLVGN